MGEGDEVIMPDFTTISCGQAITNLGAKPVPIDSVNIPGAWMLQKLKHAYLKEPRQLWLFISGHCVDMDVVLNISKI